MDRIEKIQRWKVREDLKKVAEEEARKEYIAKLTADIEALWDRAKVLIEVYNAGKKAGLPYPDNPYREGCFYSEGYGHFLGVGYYCDGIYNGDPGFGIRVRSDMNAISIRGGGACCYEIDLCDGKLHYKGMDALRRLEDFEKEYNRFEKKFYDWIDEHTDLLA